MKRKRHHRQQHLSPQQPTMPVRFCHNRRSSSSMLSPPRRVNQRVVRVQVKKAMQHQDQWPSAVPILRPPPLFQTDARSQVVASRWFSSLFPVRRRGAMNWCIRCANIIIHKQMDSPVLQSPQMMRNAFSASRSISPARSSVPVHGSIAR